MEEINNLYRNEVHDQWKEAKTMEHASGIWGRDYAFKYLNSIIKPGDTVVDIGSGAGYPTTVMSKMVGEHGKVIGVEKSAAMLGLETNQESISEKYKDISNLSFINADATNIPLKNETADKIVSFMLIHNLQLDNVKTTFKETQRILKPQGVAVFLTMHPEALFGEWDLDFIDYNKEDLQLFSESPEKEGIKVRGVVKSVGGGSKEVIMFNHTYENILNAAQAAGLRVADTKDLWIDEQTATEKFGKDSIKRLPKTPTFWIITLEKL